VGRSSVRAVGILMGGGPGSGKSTARQKFVDEYWAHQHFVFIVIDADDIKKEDPEYRELLTSPDLEIRKNAATVVHRRSSDYANLLFDVAVRLKLHLVFDGSMKNHLKTERMLNLMRGKSYETIFVGVIIPLRRTVDERLRARIRGGDPRIVPPGVVLSGHSLFLAALGEHYVNFVRFPFSNFIVYDNSAEDLHRLIFIDAGVMEAYDRWTRRQIIW